MLERSCQLTTFAQERWYEFAVGWIAKVKNIACRNTHDHRHDHVVLVTSVLPGILVFDSVKSGIKIRCGGRAWLHWPGDSGVAGTCMWRFKPVDQFGACKSQAISLMATVGSVKTATTVQRSCDSTRKPRNQQEARTLKMAPCVSRIACRGRASNAVFIHEDSRVCFLTASSSA